VTGKGNFLKGSTQSTLKVSTQSTPLARDATNGYNYCVPNGTPDRVYLRPFYQHLIPNGMPQRVMSNSVRHLIMQNPYSQPFFL